ncbi:MAG: hypothetical protein H6518_00960 [Microthrixaceae bacterium]|nr:hypothetical protein [Microthrixaceae bacterium]
MRSGLVEPTGIVVDAASGVQRGSAPEAATTFCTVDEDFTAYGLLHHRHTPEMEMVFGTSVLFRPTWRHEPQDPGHLLRPPGRTDHHGGRPRGLQGGVRRRAVRGGVRAVAVDRGYPRPEHHVTARADERTGWVVAICAIDNLVKGASGQAVQCANSPRPPRGHRPATAGLHL